MRVRAARLVEPKRRLAIEEAELDAPKEEEAPVRIPAAGGLAFGGARAGVERTR